MAQTRALPGYFRNLVQATLGIALGDHRPHVPGEIREYVSL
jgi:hypothetical protein